MKDRELRERRAQLQKQRELIVGEWEAYDARYPLEVGAHKPYDYDDQQIGFSDRLSTMDKALAGLPSTKTFKLGCTSVVLALISGLVWLVCHFII